MTKLDANTFAEAPNLETITLAENQINKIHKQAFNGLQNLRELILHRNRLTAIEKKIFKVMNIKFN